MATREAYDDDVLTYADGSWQPTAKGMQILELAKSARLLNEALRGIDDTDPPGPVPASEDAA
jgi:hypothetical protein